jgi:hypothetical protein
MHAARRAAATMSQGVHAWTARARVAIPPTDRPATPQSLPTARPPVARPPVARALRWQPLGRGRRALTGVHRERALEVERSDVEHPVGGDVGLRAALDGRVRVHRLEAPLDAHEVLLGHQVRLVEQDAVGEGHLGQGEGEGKSEGEGEG